MNEEQIERFRQIVQEVAAGESVSFDEAFAIASNYLAYWVSETPKGRKASGGGSSQPHQQQQFARYFDTGVRDTRSDWQGNQHLAPQSLTETPRYYLDCLARQGSCSRNLSQEALPLSEHHISIFAQHDAGLFLANRTHPSWDT